MLCHCAMSFFIFSNEHILYYDKNKSIISFVGTFIQKSINEISSTTTVLDRFEKEKKSIESKMFSISPHLLLYIFGLIFIFCVIVLEEVFGLLTMIG